MKAAIGKAGIKNMAVANAGQATEIVREFLEKMNPGLAFSPRMSTRTDDIWIVEVNWGFQPMYFDVKISTGEIMRYGFIPRPNP